MVRLFGIVLAAGLAVGAAGGDDSKDTKGANAAPAADAGKAKATPEAEAVDRLALAGGLIRYGRKNNAPEALVTAARILAGTPTVPLDGKPTHEPGPGGDAPAAKAKPRPDNSPRALLDEARAMSGQSEAIVRLANAVELKRGAVGGPRRTVEEVKANGTDVYRISFRGGEAARVAISGDGDTRLDLYVYDENGNLITSQVGPGDDALATWVPKWTGPFTIKVVNRGGVYNRYVIATN